MNDSLLNKKLKRVVIPKREAEEEQDAHSDVNAFLFFFKLATIIYYYYYPSNTENKMFRFEFLTFCTFIIKLHD